MIPMMPRHSSEDDRPMGLKFTRNNFFNFPKRDNNSSDTHNNSALKRSPSNASSHIAPPLMTGGTMTMKDASAYLQHSSNRDSDLSSTTSSYNPPSLSPTLPARSPFRIRDSQLSRKSHDNSILTNQTITAAATTAAKDDVYSSISSSSSSTTSSTATADDDLLAQELDNMWKLKKVVKDQKELTKLDINSDDMLMQLLISHAIIDSKEYKVLTFEEFEALKQHHLQLKKQVKNAEQKLNLDVKIQETSHSLSNLSSNKNRESVMLLLDEALEADRKVKILTQRLNELKSEEIETQYQILQHTAGVLSLGLQKLEQTHSNPVTPITPVTPGRESNHKMSLLKSELDNITSTCINLLKKHDDNFAPNSKLTTLDLLDRLEKQIKAYQSTTKESTQKLASAEERLRIDSMSEKKLEIQLRAAKEKNEKSQLQYSNLQREMDELLAQVKKDDWLPKDDFDFTDDNKVQDLEYELVSSKQNESKMAQELKLGYQEIDQLKITLSEMEIHATKITSQIEIFQQKEASLRQEMEHYREQVTQLRTEKEQWERTMKRNTIMQVLDGSQSRSEKYEQQLEEQEQEYQAQLKEQAAFLEKTTRQCEQLQADYDKLASTCQDLELLIRDKTRALDARDVQVNKLEAELSTMQQAQRAKNATTNKGPVKNEALLLLQSQFQEKEAAWIESSSAMEANFEGIMKEFDRLTGTAMEFESDKRNYERRIDQLTQEVKELESSLIVEKTKNLGYEADTPTTASLRKEFRKMINDMKADHQRALDREEQEKKKLEKQLKDLKHEREMSRYERMNKGVQTSYNPI